MLLRTRIIISIVMILTPKLANAEGFSSDIWFEKINAQMEFQNKTAEIFVNECPDLKDLVLISRDLQIVNYKIKREKSIYLLEKDPNRINNTLNFDWNEDDEAKLLEFSKIYPELKKQKQALKSINNKNPKWPELRKRFGKIRKSQEYKKALETLMKTLKKSHIEP